MTEPRACASNFRAAFLFDDPPAKPRVPVALRAPEVVLRSDFDHRIDIWSFGCYLFEIVVGQPLFSLPPFNPFGQVRVSSDDQFLHMNDDDHLLQMISTLGPLPPAMFEKWPRSMRYFDQDRNIIRTDVGMSDDPLGPVHIGQLLEQRLQSYRPQEMTSDEGNHILHVLRSALQYDPTKRLSATELLSFSWFNCSTHD